ncbi:hypothetical protein [Streptomyces mutabilis]|uniref:hypothetical protein n=1 Tax=Streptomyces mutabilis TaxID=67332 RepID=UPI00369D36FB
MDLHAWITQQVDATEAEGRAMLLDPTPLLRRCEADRRVLARHQFDPDEANSPRYATACKGCERWGEFDYPNTENLNDCPELLDLAHAHGITPDILASLERPQPPELKPHAKIAHTPSGARRLAQLLGIAPFTPMSDVPAALRGPNWKP